MRQTNSLLMCAIIVCWAVGVLAIVCTPNICDTVRCRTDVSAENCSGVFQPNGGFCGCCPLCVTIIPVGGSCINLKGMPLAAQCEEGTRCISGTCQTFPYYSPSEE